MDHNYCIPANKDPSEQAHTELDIISKMDEENVLLTLTENIEEVRKQSTPSSMIDEVLQDTKMYEFSRKIKSFCKDFVRSKQIEEDVKSMDHEAYLMQCSYSPQHDEDFKMEADFLNEEFVSDGHFKKPYSIEQPDASDKEYVTSPQTVRNRISINAEPDNENFVNTPQQFDEFVKMEESEATSVEFVSSPQIVDSINNQSENTGEANVNWSQSLQANTKVNHDPQGGTRKMEPGSSAITDLDTEPPYTCGVCGKGFMTKAVVTLHIVQFHNTKLIFKCYICGKVYLKRSSLNKHNLTHVEKCGVCGLNVIWRSLHMLNHTGERPYRCLFCGKVFISTANSNTGSSNLISTNKNGFYDCDICRKEITGRNYFTLHMKKHALTQTHLTCICRTTHGSSSDTNILVTSTQKGSLSYVKTCVSLKHNEEQGKADVNDNQNPCSFCDHQFHSEFELDIHLLTHFKGRAQDCSACVHGFTSEELLLKHLINHVVSSMYDSCDYAMGVQKEKQPMILDKRKLGPAVNYSSKQGLSEDTAGDPSYEQPHGCDVRQKGINTKRNISEHMSTHTEEQPDKCGVCGKVFIQKDHLRVHMLTHTTQQPYKCHVCEKDFTEKCFLETHLLTHPERPYQCGMCGEKFATIINLKMHMLIHTGKHAHKCRVCGKGFTQNFHLKVHMLTHTAERPHKCDVCGKGFIEKSSLTRHMMTHTAEFHHSCSVCGKGFSQENAFTYHMLSHTAVYTYKCDMCGKGLKSKTNLEKHMLTHDEGFHKCGVCGKRFIQENAFTYHMLSHTGENTHTTHKCDMCGKGLKSKTNLQKHMLTHEEGHRKCGVCGKEFMQKSGLTRHMLTHTEKVPYKCGV